MHSYVSRTETYISQFYPAPPVSAGHVHTPALSEERARLPMLALHSSPFKASDVGHIRMSNFPRPLETKTALQGGFLALSRLGLTAYPLQSELVFGS